MTPPHPKATRLQNLVWTMRAHGNEPELLNLTVLASFNPWTTLEAIREEFGIQQNGSRKLPEEVAASAPPAITHDEGDGK